MGKIFIPLDKLISFIFSSEFGVFAKKLIPKNCRFGPIEGRISNPVVPPNASPPAKLSKFRLMIRSDEGLVRTVDISDENTSNWMRFVRAAASVQEQNTILNQVK